MYKECFKLMDIDKDGTINKNDLRAAFDNVGKVDKTIKTILYCNSNPGTYNTIQYEIA